MINTAATYRDLPDDSGAEVAFGGRSNSGKSSVINALANRKNLARTSSTPGKTRRIDFFALDKSGKKRIVDLPGYGYAKVGVREHQRWEKELTRYIIQRHALKGVVIIMDIRHPLKDLDMRMVDLCQQGGKKIHLLMNKSDKIRPSQMRLVKDEIAEHLKQLSADASIGFFSALKGQGVVDLKNVIDSWLSDG